MEFLVGGTQWQAACGGNFGQTEADVVCRQLGHGPALMWYTDSKFQPSKHIVHEPIACRGTEGTIGECSLAPHIPATCDNDNEAGVFCSEPEGGKTCICNGVHGPHMPMECDNRDVLIIFAIRITA